MAIAVQSDEEWARLRRIMGRPELASDARFSNLDARKANEDELDKIVSEWTACRSPMEATEILQGEGIAAGPVMDAVALLGDPHFRERGIIVEMEHTEVGPREVAGLPIRFSDIARPAYYSAPLLGEHNDTVIGGLLGHEAAELERLKASKAVY